MLLLDCLHRVKIRRFDAPVAELADALDLGSSVPDVKVQVLSGAPNSKNPNLVPIGNGFGFVVFIDYPNFNRKL